MIRELLEEMSHLDQEAAEEEEVIVRNAGAVAYGGEAKEFRIFALHTYPIFVSAGADTVRSDLRDLQKDIHMITDIFYYARFLPGHGALS